jgi:hypothetical protein
MEAGLRENLLEEPQHPPPPSEEPQDSRYINVEPNAPNPNPQFASIFAFFVSNM